MHLKITENTYLKQRTELAAGLHRTEKHFMPRGETIPLSVVLPAEKSHIKITLGLKDGRQLDFKGFNTWYVFSQHCEVVKDDADRPTTKYQSTNAKGLKLIKAFEGLRLEAYKCPAGVWTIGYGTTDGVKPGDKITIAQAEEFLKRDLKYFESEVSRLVRVPVNGDRFSALVCFAYNVGAAALEGSTLLRLLNEGEGDRAAEQFLRWNKADDRELEGLTRRRKAERALFLGQDIEKFL